ncbi:AI-2E family transporter [Chroococcidiopsis sp.]|uniref:AI-2E family transporter n=1 Tax=Chroococcidiopsis sp. TaxID=3088168 RepID=UPI003F3F6566
MRIGQWIGFLALIISLYVLWQLRQVVLLIFAAVVLATVLNRLVRFLQRSRIPRGIAIAITVIALLAIVAGIFAIVVPRIVEQLQQLVKLLPEISARVLGWYNWVRSLIPGRVLEAAPPLSNLTQQLQSFVGGILGNFVTVLNNSLAAVVNFLLFFVLTIMLLLNPVPYRRTLTLAFPAFYRRRVDEILSECEDSLVGWIKGTLFAMVGIGVVSFIGLSLLGVPLPLVNALIAGLLEFIPNVGPTLSVIPPVLLALLDAPWKAGAVIILYLAIQQFESLVLVPIIMQREVSLLPVFTILAVVVFASLFGFLGLFLAIPLLIVTQIWLKEVLVKDILNRWQGEKESKEDKETRGQVEV